MAIEAGTTRAGFYLLVALLHELGPICKRACQHAGVDKVEFIREVPFILDVVNEELDIGRRALEVSG
jgi:hypothetical protein